MTFIEHLLHWANQRPAAPAVARGQVPVYTWSQLASRVCRLATGFRHSGLTIGTRVVLVLRNSEEFFESLLACWYAGLVPVPVNARLHEQELLYILEHSQASLCLVSPGIQLSSTPAGCRLIEVSSTNYRQLFDFGESAIHQSDKNDLAWLFYTSGTTGRPKGAMLTHLNLAAMCQCYFNDIDVESPWQAILHPAPLSHGSGLYSLAHLMKGSCQVLPESGGFNAAEVFELIAAWPDCVFFAAPTMIKRLTDFEQDRDVENLKAVIFGGAPMYLQDIKCYLDRYGPRLAQLYGQGESPMTITGMSSHIFADTEHPRWEHRIASAGVAQSAVEVRVVDDQARDLESGDSGEVIVRGASVMKGYWNDEKASSLALRDNWLWTGDIGSLDEDGYLSLKDRSKDLVISGGSNIYPREVEEILLRHPLVREVSVIGRAHADWGEVVIAYLVLYSDSTPIPTSLGALSGELDTLCLNNIARFKRPKAYRLISELPKNNYGKILKTRLRELEAGYDELN